MQKCTKYRITTVCTLCLCQLFKTVCRIILETLVQVNYVLCVKDIRH